PRCNAAILLASMSTHTTSFPLSAKQVPVTRPTYPVPTTHNFTGRPPLCSGAPRLIVQQNRALPAATTSSSHIGGYLSCQLPFADASTNQRRYPNIAAKSRFARNSIAESARSGSFQRNPCRFLEFGSAAPQTSAIR